MAHKFEPKNWERLISEERRQLLDPENALDLIGVPQGIRVADVGAGPGFFTLPLASRVGAAGRVDALDVSPEMVEILRSRRLPPQVYVQLSDEHTLPLPDAVVDLVLLAFVFHELEDRERFLGELTRVLRPGGRLAVIDWVPRAETIGPPEKERVAEVEVVSALRATNFHVSDRRQMNDSQYLVIASPVGHPGAA
ncbi:MAG: class I SAM-dependent methyltransferase [Gemmatimonadaceae bacterium]|nr:class I SAM-dependent methyltransferase [Gemmatimonadaceae bacterium]